MKTLTSHILSVFVLASLLIGCQTIDVRGQYVDNAALTELEKRNLTKAEIVELIGTPTIVPEYNQDTWYYIQRSTARRAWSKPKVVEQRVIKIVFNSNDSIKEVTSLNDLHVEDVTIISEYTQTHGTEKNGLQKFVGNIGRYSNLTSSKKKPKRK